MGISKQKYCKCGHNKDLHKGKSKFSIATYCRTCPCSSYMNRNKPFKIDYAVACVSVGVSIAILIMTVVLLTESDPALKGTQNEIITFTLGELHEIMELMFMMINVFVVLWLVVDPVIDILHAKKRREFPLDDPNGKL